MLNNRNLSIAKCLFIFLLMLPVASAHTQPGQQLWKVQIAHDWHRVNSLGYLIVGSIGRLSALDPETGNKLWERNDLGTLREQQVEDINGTSLLRIAYGVEPGEEDRPMIAMIDVVTGKTVFDSNTENLGVLATYVLPKSGNMLVVGVKPGQFFATLLMYSLETGKMLWKNDQIFKATVGGKGGFLNKVAATVKTAVNMQSLISFPVEADNQSMIIVHPSYVINLNSETGEQLWRADIDESQMASLIYSPYQPNQLFVGTSRESEGNFMSNSDPNARKTFFSVYYGFDLKTGKQNWKTKAIGEQLVETIPLENGLAVFFANDPKGTFNLLDYATGTGLWGNKGKGLKTSGSLVDYIRTEDGIVLASGGIGTMISRGVEYYLNVLDEKKGALRFDKSVKVKGRLISTEITPKGILFITTHEVNILDPSTGNLVLSSSIQSEAPRKNFQKPFPTASTETHLYVFATGNKNIIELDKKTGTTRQVNVAPIELGGKELPKSIDLFPDGIVLSSDQNVVMVGYDGKIRHAQYYEPPTQPGWIRAIALAEAIKAAYVGILAAGVSASITQKTSGMPNQEQGRVAAAGSAALSIYAFAYAGQALKEFNRRLKATTATEDYIILLNEPVKRDIKLLQIDKKTGSVLTTMDIGRDREPVYSVDFIDRKVFYLSRPNEITCFKIK